jgi:CheY-like chemotaxis protein
MHDKETSVEVLLVEDSPGDVRLTREAFRDTNPAIRLHVANDGVEALAFLRQEGSNAHAPRPDLVLLDLNLPKMDGREVLAYIKEDAALKTIPTVILTSTEAESDVVKSYQLQANCYLSKPMHFEAFHSLVKSINDFWLTRVKLPQQRKGNDKGGNHPLAKGTIMKAIGGNDMPIQVLLVEDSPGDVRLTQEAFRDANQSILLHVAADGVEAMAFLRREGAHAQAPRPDLILLDLNLPKMDGREVLAHIKENDNLKTIPTVILTTSDAESDIVKSYELQANCYLTKPVQLDAFEGLVKSINDFWLTKVKLPQQEQGG